MMKNYQPVSVIFPTLNSAHLLPSFFNSLKQQTYPQKNLEVIIVDNHSKDKTVETINNLYPKARVIRLTKNIGFARAITLAANKAKGKIIFITNDDVTFNRPCIEDLVNLITSDPKIGMVSGKLMLQKPKSTSAWPGFKLNP